MYEQILDACHFPVDKHKNFGSQSELPFIIKNCSSQKIEENDNTEKEKYQRLTKKRPRLTKKCEVKKGVLDEPQKEPAKLLDDVVSRLLCNNDSGSIEFNPERAGEFAAIMGSVQRLQEVF
jgi:hypothetical protein